MNKKTEITQMRHIIAEYEKGNEALLREYTRDYELSTMQGEQGHNLLNVAIFYGYSKETVLFLLTKHATPNIKINEFAHSSLEWAAIKDRVDCIDVLLNHGAGFVDSALYWAVHSGSIEFMKQLLVNCKVNPSNRCINDPRGDGFNSVMLAAKEGKENILELLLSHGADVNMVSRAEFMTATMLAARNHHVECLRLLLEKKPDLEKHVSQWGNRGTALMMASGECLKLLLENGANPNAEKDDGGTALHLAAERGSPDDVKLLLRYEADPNKKTRKRGLIPINFAVKMGSKSSSKLKFFGADLSEPERYLECTKLLVESNGHNVSASDVFEKYQLKQGSAEFREQLTGLYR